MAENIPVVDQAADDDQTVVADLLHQVNRKIRHVSRTSTKTGDVTFGQIRALRQLRLCAEPIRMSELADRLSIVRRSVTTVVDDLESAGLAARLPDPDDRRATLVVITDSGRAALRDALDQRRTAAATVLAGLTSKQLADLRRLLSVAVEGDGCQ